MHISLIPEYILGMDILEGLTFKMMAGEFRLQCRVIKVINFWRTHKIVSGKITTSMLHNLYSAISPAVGWGAEEITQTIQKLTKVGIVYPPHGAFSNPVWHMQKLNGTWRMTVDYWELNKVTHLPFMQSYLMLFFS